MARTSEMKLHESKVTARNGKTYNVNSFYDTHIRQWTAFLVCNDGYQTSAAFYATTKKNAIDECIECEVINYGGK